MQDNSAFLPGTSPSVIGAEEVARVWPEDDIGNSGALVFRRESGLMAEDEETIRTVEEWLRSADAPDNVRSTQSPYSRPELEEALVSPDGKVVLLVVVFSTAPFTPETDAAVETIRGHVRRTVPSGLEVHLTGNAGVATDQSTAIDAAVERTTIITLVLVVAILLWVYRSPVTAIVPLTTVGIALGVSRGVIALLAERGFDVSGIVETFMVVIIFGAGTDYCLFIVSRFKEELGVGPAEDRRRVLVGTMAVIGGVIASSAATVIVGFASQGVADFGLYRTSGPAMAIAVVITLLAGLTLTPALLALFGRWAFWPWKPQQADEDEGDHPEPETAPAGAPA
ncbi:MAG: MMPL family transporter [Actinomycetota bacterium]|nr:MMPL family transporter [Actinomycetota bacterium]